MPYFIGFMCLVVPAKVIKVTGEVLLLDTLGEKTEARIEPASNLKPAVNDWVIVQFGMVTRIIDEVSAKESIREWKQIMNL